MQKGKILKKSCFPAAQPAHTGQETNVGWVVVQVAAWGAELVQRGPLVPAGNLSVDTLYPISST